MTTDAPPAVRPPLACVRHRRADHHVARFHCAATASAPKAATHASANAALAARALDGLHGACDRGEAARALAAAQPALRLRAGRDSGVPPLLGRAGAAYDYDMRLGEAPTTLAARSPGERRHDATRYLASGNRARGPLDLDAAEALGRGAAAAAAERLRPLPNGNPRLFAPVDARTRRRRARGLAATGPLRDVGTRPRTAR
jgi:hypothetical protein